MLKENKVYFAHFRSDDYVVSAAVDGVATVAVRVVGKEMRYAVSWCSPKDNFSKAHGRHLASTRLDSGDCASILGFYPKKSMTPYQICAMCLRIELQSTTAPSWAACWLVNPIDY